jgi:hypothetical protein
MESRMEAWRVERRVYIVFVEVVGERCPCGGEVRWQTLKGSCNRTLGKKPQNREGETEVKERSNGP